MPLLSLNRGCALARVSSTTPTASCGHLRFRFRGLFEGPSQYLAYEAVNGSFVPPLRPGVYKLAVCSGLVRFAVLPT
jgi:hypothetical protein